MAVDADALAEAGGYFLSLLGTVVIGISLGLGLESFMIKKRLGCGQLVLGNRTTEAGLNVTTACGDILGASNTMILATAGGGTVVFFCGLAVFAYAKGGIGNE